MEAAECVGSGGGGEVSLHAECSDSDKSAVRVQCCFRFTETVRGAQDVHLDFHTAPELWYSPSPMLLYVHGDRTNYKGRGAQDGHLDFHTELLSSEVMYSSSISVLLYVHGDRTNY